MANIYRIFPRRILPNPQNLDLPSSLHVISDSVGEERQFWWVWGPETKFLADTYAINMMSLLVLKAQWANVRWADTSEKVFQRLWSMSKFKGSLNLRSGLEHRCQSPLQIENPKACFKTNALSQKKKREKIVEGTIIRSRVKILRTMKRKAQE